MVQRCILQRSVCLASMYVLLIYVLIANCQLGLFKSILLLMIGVRGGIPREDFKSIRLLMRTFAASGHDSKSSAYKQLNMMTDVPTARSATLKKYAPHIDMSVFYIRLKSHVYICFFF